MDADYGRNFSEGDKPFQDFEHSLFVLSTVQSVSVSTLDMYLFKEKDSLQVNILIMWS